MKIQNIDQNNLRSNLSGAIEDWFEEHIGYGEHSKEEFTAMNQVLKDLVISQMTESYDEQIKEQ